MVSSSNRKTFTIQSDSCELEKLRSEIGALLTVAGFGQKDRESVLVALCEAVTNSIRHSYHGKPGQPVEITFEEAADKIILRVRDYGEKVDLEQIKAKSNPELPPVNPGGLGLYFMKTIMDGMEYNTAHSQGNELILIKNKLRSAS